MSQILEELENLGHIVIMDKEEGDYEITTTDPFTVMRILDRSEINYQSVYNLEYNNYTIDFNLFRRA